MNEEAAGGIVTVLGVLLLKLVTSGRFVDYVRPRMRPLLLVAAGVLIAAGASALMSDIITGVRLRSSRRRGSSGRAEPTGPEAIARTGLLVVIPIVLLAAVPPAPLGAFAAGLSGNAGRAPPASHSIFPPLAAPSGGAVTLGVSDFVSRALYDPAGSLKGVTVRLVGFAAPDPHGPAGSFDLVRFAIYCCAADAIALRVRIDGVDGPIPVPDTWIQVTGSWHPAAALAPGAFDPNIRPVLDAASVRVIPAPSNPYDSTI